MLVIILYIISGGTRAGRGKTRSISPPSTGQSGETASRQICPQEEEEEEEEEDTITTGPGQRILTVLDITRRTPTTTASALGCQSFQAPNRTKKAITSPRPRGERERYFVADQQEMFAG